MGDFQNKKIVKIYKVIFFVWEKTSLFIRDCFCFNPNKKNKLLY